MGVLSKAWKGVKKTFKKIGKGIKKGFKTFGKFMGKIGIVGQIAMIFLTGGIGNAMMSTFGSVLNGLGAVATGGGAFAGIAGAAQTVLGAAGNFARLVAKPFTTVTDAVTSFIGNTSKYLANKIPGMSNFVAKLPGNMTLADAPDTFFGLGEGSVIGNVGKGIADNVAGFANIGKDLVSGDLGSFGVKAAPLKVGGGSNLDNLDPNSMASKSLNATPADYQASADSLGTEFNPNQSFDMNQTAGYDIATGSTPAQSSLLSPNPIESTGINYSVEGSTLIPEAVEKLSLIHI